MIKNLLIFGMLIILSSGCSNNSPTEEHANEEPIAEEPIQVEEPVELEVIMDNLRMRDQPGEKGKEIIRLPEGTKLSELGEVSDFTTSIKLRGVKYDEPWLKVKTAQGQEGWVYAAGVALASGINQDYSQKLLNGRLKSFFGEQFADEIKSYRNDFSKINSSEDFFKAYSEGIKLRDTIVSLIEVRAFNIDAANAPDLNWLEQAMPGFVDQLVAEGTQAYLFADYKKWRDKAKGTAATDDDDFTELSIKVHDVDSIEYFYPSWFMQTWDYGGHSLLGKGIHTSILDDIKSHLSTSKVFEAEYLKIKDQILNDITASYMTYWESKEKILTELDTIIERDYDFLTKENKIELAKRKEMFENHKANKIKVNQRSGM